MKLLLFGLRIDNKGFSNVVQCNSKLCYIGHFAVKSIMEISELVFILAVSNYLCQSIFDPIFKVYCGTME